MPSTSTSGTSPAPNDTAQAVRVWLRSTAGVALAMTCLDAALLQQKKAFFTGGFLSGAHTRTPGEAAAFLSISFAVDASVVGALSAIILLAFSRIPLTRRARLLLVSAGAAMPLVVWDFVNYSLLTHLGDTFDLGLMFDLAGNASELFAVASSHLVVPVALVVSGTALLAVGVSALNRYSASPRTRAGFSRRLLAPASGLFAAGLLVFAVSTSASDVVEDGLRRKASGQMFTGLAARLTDFDRDGYGVGGRTSDPAPFDAAIYPYALDLPLNGIDENAIGGDLPAADPAYVEQAPPATAWRHRPDVVLFVLESFRADAVGRTVGGRPVTPVMDAIAGQGAFTRAFSHNGYTTQSRFHLLTGNLAGLNGAGSLIDDFKAQGYETAYFSAQDESFGGPVLGVGFERADVRYDARQDRGRRYSTFTTAGSLAVTHAVLRERIEEFVRHRDGGRPLFLYVNFHDTHFPYHHRDIETIVSDRIVDQSRIAPSQRDALREMYYNTAANVDRALGATLDLVASATRREPAVIVTADHGESLFDEGFLGHGYSLNDAQTRVPMIVRGLPLEIVEPFGQSDLRGAIGAALSRDLTAGDMKPRVSGDPRKAVFQYLGSIHRPRQIGFASGAGRLIYDFRDRRVLFDNGTSVKPEALTPEASAPVLRLVHSWERMMLARAAAGANRDESP